MQSAPAALRLDSDISFWGRFVSPEMEARFRRHQRPQEARQINFAVGLGIVATLPFISLDHRVFGLTTWFWILQIGRAHV